MTGQRPPDRRRARRPAPLAAAVALTLAGCASSRDVAPRPAAEPASVAVGWTEEGLASWYGEPYHGRATASGRRYDMWEMTAAHRTLPFGSRVRVTNRANGRRAEVLVNDRGPFVPGRILDLSRAAAEALGAVAAGVVPVRLEVLHPGDGMADHPCWEVQVGAFARPGNARRAVADLEGRGHAVRTAPAGGGLTRVRVTGVGGRDAAVRLAAALAAGYPGALALPCGGPP